MKYAFLLCLLPFLASAQQQGNKLLDKFSVEINAGILSSKMSGFGEILCDQCPKDVIGIVPMTAKYYAGTLSYALAKKHHVGVGIVLTEHGFGYYYRQLENKYGINIYESASKYTALKLQHDYNLLEGKKIRFNIANSFDGEYRNGIIGNHMANNEEYNKKFALTHLLRLSFGIQLLPKIELSFGPLLRTNLTKHYKNSYNGNFHRFGYGTLLGLRYNL